MHRRDIFALGKLSGRYAVISKNKIFCDVGNNIICLSFETGEVLWKAEAVGDSVHIDQRLVTYSTVGNFFCLNAETGEIYFKNRPTEIHGLNVSKPYVSGNIFFVGTNKIIAIDINNGNLLWDFQSDEEETYFFDPVYVDGNLFVGCSDGYLYCFNSQPE